MDNNDLDKIFRDAFDEAQETPHHKVWDNIEAKLDEKSSGKVIAFLKKNWTK